MEKVNALFSFIFPHGIENTIELMHTRNIYSLSLELTRELGNMGRLEEDEGNFFLIDYWIVSFFAMTSTNPWDY